MRRVVRRRIFLGSVAAVLVVGYATLDVYDVVPGVLTLANAPDPTPAAATSFRRVLPQGPTPASVPARAPKPHPARG